MTLYLKHYIWTSEIFLQKQNHLKMQRTLKAIVIVFGAFIVKITSWFHKVKIEWNYIELFYNFFFFTACVLKLLFCVQKITSLFAVDFINFLQSLEMIWCTT